MAGTKKIYLYLWAVIFLAFGVLIVKDRVFPPKENIPARPVSAPEAVTASSSATAHVSLIRIFSPVFDELVTSPLTLEGEVAYAARLGYRLKDATGKIVAQGTVTVSDRGVGQPRTFKTEIAFSDVQTATGTLEVFDAAASRESAAGTVTIPVAFRP